MILLKLLVKKEIEENLSATSTGELGGFFPVS